METNRPETTVYISCNGCNRRLLDARRLRSYFVANGCRIVDNPRNANYNIFFASALNRIRIDESFNIIRKLSQYKGETIVLGCLMEVAPSEFRNFWKFKALPIKDMDSVDGFFPWFTVKYKDIPPQNIPAPSVNIYRTISPYTYFKQGLGTMLSPARVGDKIYSFLHREQKEDYTYTYIWVSTGCPNLCSYCAERKVVGMPVSRPVGDIVHEYNRLLKDGKRTFEFIGDDVGSYGLDIGTDLPELFNKLSVIDKNYQVAWVIKHLHPKYIVKYKDDLIKMAGDKKISEIICCFQSGSNRLLELMNRHHTIEEVIQVLKEFRKAIPGIKLATNIIVGFPTETDEEFLQTLHVFDQVYFNRVHMIKYYDAEGSDSHGIFPKVSDQAIRERIKFAKKFLKERDIYFQTRD